MRTSSPLLALLLLASAPATAEDLKTATTSVTYSDLDLNRPAGVAALMKRLTRASDRVCGERPMSVLFGQLKSYLACRETAVANAVREIDVPAVTLAFENPIDARPVGLASR
jgi:UrcA family protein